MATRSRCRHPLPGRSPDGGLAMSTMPAKEHTRPAIGRSTPRDGSRTRWPPSFAGDHVAPKVARLTVREWSDKRLDGYRTRRKSTVRQAEVHLKLIKEHFGAVPMAWVKPSDVRGWTAQLKAEGRADSYVYALHARLSQLFSDAVHDDIVPRNPCSRRTSPGTGKQRPYVATTEQVWALHNAVPAGIRPAILLGAHAGLRLAEAAALRPEDVDFFRGVVSPTIQWPNEPLKSDTSKTRIPIPNDSPWSSPRLSHGEEG
jgi:integrase